MHIQRASELRNAEPPRATLLRSVPSGVFPLREYGGQARQRSWATVLFRNNRLRWFFAGADPVARENKHLRGHCADGGVSAASARRFPPQTSPRRGAKSDVRQPIKRGLCSCRVAIATYEETHRIGRKICTMRYLGIVAMDNSPRVLTCRPEEEPIMANQLGRAARLQCRFGSLSGGVGRPYGKKTN